jgi:hypothetical protein
MTALITLSGEQYPHADFANPHPLAVDYARAVIGATCAVNGVQHDWGLSR